VRQSLNKSVKRLFFLLIALAAVFTFLVNQNAPKDSISVRHNIAAIEKNALKIEKWATWKKEPSTFVWQFPELETIVVTKGEVYVTPDGESQSVLIKQGDFATFAPGLRCTWRVTQAFEKQVMLADTPLTSFYWRIVFKSKAVLRHAKKFF
jgi:uncharacterized protein